MCFTVLQVDHQSTQSRAIVGADITLRCRCEVDKPVATLLWFRQRADHLGSHNMTEKSWPTLAELRVRMLGEYDGAMFLCLVKSGEDELFD